MPHADYVPQLATLVKTPPSGGLWWHEIKFDGYRIGLHIQGTRIALISRNGKDWTAAFPEIVEAARRLRTHDALLDGEVAMVLPDGRTSFQALQSAGSNAAARDSLVYFVFDLLRIDGRDLHARSLADRKSALKALVGGGGRGRVRYSEHVEGDGPAFLEQACRVGLEGIISKRVDRPYHHGRNSDWVKAKCGRRQEFVVGGFTDPAGTRAGLGALLIGCYDGNRLVFAGKVGTGFTHQGALALRRQLDPLQRSDSPFDPLPPRPIARRAHWVRPELVCDVSFTEWTGDGMVRHPSFQGLRADKSPHEVRRERSEAPSPPGAPSVGRTGGSAPKSRKAGAAAEVAGVRITHPDRVLYPDPHVTKLDLARYYERIADWVVPHVAGRPLTLVRCPEGLAGSCFYVKHSKTWAPEPLRRVHIREKTKVGEYLVADDLAGVVALVQMGVLEIHTWSSMAADVERPNRLIVDLDPGAAVDWPRVVAAARLVRQALGALDLDSYCKTTGGRGLHVVAPLVPHAGWDDCLTFTRLLSEALERADPESYTTNFSKRGRQNKILLDFLRNNRANTSVAAYSGRAREGAPVSVPLSWDELRPSLKPAAFTVTSVPGRLARLAADPWKGYWSSRQSLTPRLLRAVAGQG
jgi:bifunctional non-homologous end joining protein LigD